MNNDLFIKTEHPIRTQQVSDLITTFIESGGYITWVRGVKFYKWDENNDRHQVPYADTWAEGSTFYDGRWSIDIAVDDDDDTVKTLGWKKLKWALERPDMKRHARDFVDDNIDVETADCVVQMALFKEIVYG